MIPAWKEEKTLDTLMWIFSTFSTGVWREIKDSTPLSSAEMNGQFTHLIELNPLLVFLGTGVGDPQGSKLGPEQVGGILL